MEDGLKEEKSKGVIGKAGKGDKEKDMMMKERAGSLGVMDEWYRKRKEVGPLGNISQKVRKPPSEEKDGGGGIWV